MFVSGSLNLNQVCSSSADDQSGLNHELPVGGCVLVSGPVADVLALAKRLRLQMNQES